MKLPRIALLGLVGLSAFLVVARSAEPPPAAPAPVDERIERYHVFQFNKSLKEAEDALAEGLIHIAAHALEAALKNRPSVVPDPERLQRIQAKLDKAFTPIAVTLNSDGKTWVSLENIELPYQQKTKTLKLTPGIYVATGRRRGYPNVTVQFEVTPGMTPPTVTVECKR